ncbi:hypothetical protein ACJX0J_007332, partial [Zea mays]
GSESEILGQRSVRMKIELNKHIRNVLNHIQITVQRAAIIAFNFLFGEPSDRWLDY